MKLLSEDDLLKVLDISISDISLIEQIASGTFSDVYRGIWQYTEVAIKVIKLIEAERDEITNAKKEISVLM